MNAMKTMAIICEYNPFHNGHAYQISQHRNKYGVDCVIAVMSGNFVQRGAPAVCDKWTRAKMAVMGGCDLVVELPTVFATQSAERFAFGAVSLINYINQIDYLSFGSECGDIALLKTLAANILKPEFNECVSDILKSGISYPAARQKAVSDSLGKIYEDLLTKPNNLLAVEYLKNLLALGSNINPITLKRTIGHHDTENNDNFCSATHLRNLISNCGDASDFIPEISFKVFCDAVTEGKAPANNEPLDILSSYLLRTLTPDMLKRLPDMTEGLESRFIDASRSSVTFDEIAEAVKTKRYTRTRINRTLIHLLLGITKDDIKAAPTYLRVLAANSTGTEFLKTIKEKCNIVTKAADANFDQPEDRKMFEIDCRATDVYAQLYPDKKHNIKGIDFLQSPIIIK
jgi:predicted nucleotidyltransferase